jgi:hypothetical protein
VDIEENKRRLLRQQFKVYFPHYALTRYISLSRLLTLVMGAVVNLPNLKSCDALAPQPDENRRSETKALTHDGYIWPVPQAEMKIAAAIIERMAEDFDKVVKTQNRVTLSSFGWTSDQLISHRASAVARYKRTQAGTGGFSTNVRSFAAGAAELACLTTFSGMVGVWAIILGA